MSNEADIVKDLSRPFHEIPPHQYAALIAGAGAEITKLRAERDAAARDMRERCAQLAESRRGFPTAGALIAADIRDLAETPAIMATDRKDAT